MDAGVAVAKTLNLRPGVALSAAQMAALTDDIVWMVEKEVTLADGSVQKVLAPQVYARVRQGDLDGSGALLAGRNVDIRASGNVVNSGTIAGRDTARLVPSYLTGMNLTQRVSVQTLSAGKPVWQYQTAGAPQGNWYSLSPSVQPSELGISPLGFNRTTQTIEPKIFNSYFTTGPVNPAQHFSFGKRFLIR